MADDQRFDGWKAIGNFLGRDRTTAMRWMRERGLPVHRVPGGRTGTVYALRNELSDWLVQGGDAAPTGPAVSPATGLSKPPMSSRPKWRGTSIALGALVLAVIGGALAVRPPTDTRPHTFGIAAAVSSDDDAASRRFAGELTADLARFANASAGLAVYDDAAAGRSDVGYRLQTSVDRRPGGLTARMWLVSADDGSILWSRQLEQDAPEIAILRERVAANVVGVARCAFASMAEEPRRLASAETALLLSMCQHLVDADYDGALTPIRALAKARPDLALGWASLAIVEAAVAENGTKPSLMADARRNAAQAMKIAPDQTLSQLASVSILSVLDPTAFALVERALRQHPDEPRLLRQWSRMLFAAGYVQDSVAPALRAVANDPTWMTGRDFAVRRLSAANRFDEAFREQAEDERLWPGHPAMVEQRQRLKSDAAMARTATDTPPADAAAEQAEMARTVSREPQTAYALAPSLYRMGAQAEALAMLAKAPVGAAAMQQWMILFFPGAAGVRTEPAFFRKMVALGLPAVWKARRKWPDFCAEPGLRYDCAKEAAKLGVPLG